MSGRGSLASGNKGFAATQISLRLTCNTIKNYVRKNVLPSHLTQLLSKPESTRDLFRPTQFIRISREIWRSEGRPKLSDLVR